jgi:hypothetical protein
MKDNHKERARKAEGITPQLLNNIKDRAQGITHTIKHCILGSWIKM